jgi:putative redox protein
MAKDVSVHSEAPTYSQKITAGTHVFHSDEPEDSGGKDAGPNPEKLLLAALGACANITAQMYAQRKAWPLHDVYATLSYVRVPAESNAESGLVDCIEMEISFDGDLSGEQRQRLLEIANRCPVHRMLISQVQIRSKLVDPEPRGGPSGLNSA